MDKNRRFKAYTYYLYHIPTTKKYYGARQANQCEPANDLWNEYFSSSKLVVALIEEYGKASFVAEVRKTFDTAKEAFAWEQKVIDRMHAVERDDWLNQSNGIGPFWSDQTGIPKSEEHNQKNRMAQLNRKDRPDYSGSKNPFYNKRHSDETKATIKEKRKHQNMSHAYRSVVTPLGLLESLTSAAKAHNMEGSTIFSRCASKKYIDYQFIGVGKAKKNSKFVWVAISNSLGAYFEGTSSEVAEYLDCEASSLSDALHSKTNINKHRIERYPNTTDNRQRSFDFVVNIPEIIRPQKKGKWKPVKTPFGVFESCKLAAKALHCTATAISIRCSTQDSGYEYITRSRYEECVANGDLPIYVKSKLHMGTPVMSPYGVFESVSAASRYSGEHINTIMSRCRACKDNYQYITKRQYYEHIIKQQYEEVAKNAST